jgi:DNA-binding beta-propeller fold protein YncE
VTGGGFVDTTMGRIHHIIDLRCSLNQQPNQLNVHWRGNEFHLQTLTSVICYDDPSIPNPSNASFDTIIGTGTGTYNGQPATIEFRFTDAGEPGSNDWAQYTVRDSGGNVVVSVSDTLDGGNHQTHGTCPAATPTGIPSRRLSDDKDRMYLSMRLYRARWDQR